METIKNNKRGISLIVLVITIIVMIILAAAIILSLSSNGLIDRANEAVNLSDENQVEQAATLAWTDAFLDKKRGDDLANEVITKLSESGITTENWNILVTDSGVRVTDKRRTDYIKIENVLKHGMN